MADGRVGVKQSADADRQIDNEVRTNGSGQEVYVQRVADWRTSGTWGYSGGASGTVALSGTKRVMSIAAHAAASGATVAINGGDAIPVPTNNGITIEPKGNLTDPSIVFTGTDSYMVEHVTG